MITFEEAKRLSILKWEYLSQNDGPVEAYYLTCAIPEIIGLLHCCGFCELYYNQGKSTTKDICGKCPLAIGYENTKYSACVQDAHPFSKYEEAETEEEYKKYALEVLELCKNAKDPEL